MVRRMRRLFVLLAFAACGGDDGGTTVDAPKGIDAKPVTVLEVQCPATPAGTVMTTDSSFTFMPMQTMINQGGIVQFTTSLTHNVVPGSNAFPDADLGLSVGFDMTKCLMFTQTGTYGFHCGPHGFVGSIIVQ
jgi:plastocyanin